MSLSNDNGTSGTGTDSGVCKEEKCGRCGDYGEEVGECLARAGGTSSNDIGAGGGGDWPKSDEAATEVCQHSK